jgi:hypothetical protein
MILISCLVAAVAVLFWPSHKTTADYLPKFSLPKASEPVRETVSYEAAIHDLAHMRLRLIATDHLDEDVKAAIDTITLALVAGSDKQ